MAIVNYCVHVFVLLTAVAVPFARGQYCVSSSNAMDERLINMYCTGHDLPQFNINGNVNYSYIHIVECGFTNVSNATFPYLNHVEEVIINCAYRDANKSLTIEEGTFDSIAEHLTTLSLAKNNINRLPDKMFCNLPILNFLSLDWNDLSDPRELGFGGHCDAFDSQCDNELRILNLTSNGIRSIPANSFCNFIYLEELYLSSNMIESMDNAAFQNLSVLKVLQLDKNKLLHLSSDMFYSTPSLTKLYLSRNSLTDDVYLIFQNLTELKEFDLSYNRLEHAGEVVTVSSGHFFINLPNIQACNFAGNRITTIGSKSLFGLKNAWDVYLGNNSISAIAEDAFIHFNSLEVLDLKFNNLATLPKIKPRYRFHIMDCSYNELTDPNDLDLNLKEIVYVLLSGNKMTTVRRTSFSALTRTGTIDLSHNLIDAIEPGSFNVTMNSLQLNNNKLTSIAGAFNVAIGIDELNLSYNFIKHLSYDDLPVSLQRLYIAHNKIFFIGQRSVPLKNLKILDLSNNFLQILAGRFIPDSIQLLNLNNNNLSRIQDGIFASKEHLVELRLKNNSFKIACKNWFSMPFNEFSLAVRPRVLFSGNPLLCSCENFWLSYVNALPFINLPSFENIKSMPCRFEMRQSAMLTIQEAADNKLLLCTAEHGKEDTCFCSKGRLVGLGSNYSSSNKCYLSCPRSCKCARNEDRTFVATVCSRANLTEVPRDISTDVIHLNLAQNSFSTLGNGSFEKYFLLENLNLNHSHIYHLDDFVFQNQTLLTELTLSFNYLENLTDSVFVGLHSLKRLFLNSNKLRRIASKTFEPLVTLQILQLQDNRLVDFPVWDLPKLSITALSISYNPWSCDCSFLWKFRQWLQDYVNIIKDSNSVHCVASNKNGSFSGSIFAVNEMCFNASSETVVVRSVDQSSILGATIGTMAFIIICCIFCHIYRWEIRVLIYSRYGVKLFHSTKDIDEDSTKVYDAFIAYSCLDDEFLVHDLLPGLEEIEFPYKLCIHQRNFPAGALISDSILEAVALSRRTILLLSQNFFESEWCRLEFKTAHAQLLKDKRNRLIVILLGKIPKNLDNEMKLYTRTKTYLVWSEKLFWQKLYFEMPGNKRRRQ